MTENNAVTDRNADHTYSFTDEDGHKWMRYTTVNSEGFYDARYADQKAEGWKVTIEFSGETYPARLYEEGIVIDPQGVRHNIAEENSLLVVALVRLDNYLTDRPNDYDPTAVAAVENLRG